MNQTKTWCKKAKNVFLIVCTFFKIFFTQVATNKRWIEQKLDVKMRKMSPRRGIEPRSPAWQAGILTTILSRTWLQFQKLYCTLSQHSGFCKSEKFILITHCLLGLIWDYRRTYKSICDYIHAVWQCQAMLFFPAMRQGTGFGTRNSNVTLEWATIFSRATWNVCFVETWPASGLQYV